MQAVMGEVLRRSGLHRSGRWFTVLFVVGTLAALVSCSSGLGGDARPAFVPPFIGTLQTMPGTAAAESANGVKVAMLELDWADYETAPGSFDVGYENRMKAEMATLTSAGMRVTLGLGIHFTPTWVKGLPNSTFVDQNGRVSTVLDMTFNSMVRSAVQQYIDRVNQSFGLANFWAVRITAGGSSELFYPGGGSYWAFGRNPQNGPQYPSSLAPNPYPGWRPGDDDLTPVQVREWFDWYVAALADTANWQMGLLAGLGFTGYYQILTPGVGILPGALERAIQNDLPNGLAGRGAAWDAVYRLLPHRSTTVAYVTSVGDGSGGDVGCSPDDVEVPLSSAAVSAWSSTRWISRVADEFHLTKAGENPGYAPASTSASEYRNSSTDGLMAKAVALAKSCGFQGLYWAHDAQLWNGTVNVEGLFAYTSPEAGSPGFAQGG